MPKYQVWYMKPSQFREGIMGFEWCMNSGKLPNVRELNATHVYVKTIEVPTLIDVFMHMQAAIWSPNGEARDTITKLGLHHTSMCIGDLTVAENGVVAVCDVIGWKELGTAVTHPQAHPPAFVDSKVWSGNDEPTTGR